MPDRAPPTEPSDLEAHPRRRAPRARASDAEALALVERAAAIPDGRALLERAPLECAAVLLGVDPRAVERVRAALEDRALRGEAALAFERAAGRRRPSAPARGSPPPPRDPAALVAAARRREGGLAILLDAAPECAAVVFGVHPELVHRARALLAHGDPGAAAT